jgi:hypothetical protein
MLFKSNFFYNADAPDGGGGSTGTLVENQQAAPTLEAPAIPEEIQKELEAWKSAQSELAELRAFREANQKPEEKSPAELLREQELDKVNFRKFAVENEFAKEDDFVQLETLQQRKDYDLIFENFKKDFKEENPDITDEKELEEAAKEDFETTYKLNSANEKAKEKGLAKLAKEANDIRNPYSSKITAAKAEYETKKETAATYEKKFIPFTQKIKETIPAKLTYSKIKSGDNEVEIDIDVTPEDVKEVEEKFLKTHKAFYDFKNGKPEEVQEKLLGKITNYLMSKKREEGNTKLAEKFEAIGIAKGSTTGADAPFAMKQSNARQEAKLVTLEQSNNKIAEARARFN